MNLYAETNENEIYYNLFSGSMIKQKDSRFLIDVRMLPFPVPDGLYDDGFFSRSEFGSKTEECTFPATFQDCLENLDIPVGRFDEDLGLIQGINISFKLFQSFHPDSFVNRQVTCEREILSIES